MKNMEKWVGGMAQGGGWEVEAWLGGMVGRVGQAASGQGEERQGSWIGDEAEGVGGDEARVVGWG